MSLDRAPRRMSPLVALLTLCLVGGTSAPSTSQAPDTPAGQAAPKDEILFDDVSDAVGVQFIQTSAPEKKYILESMSGGVALLDVDNDGWQDIYLVNSLTVDTADQPKSAPSALFRNLGVSGDASGKDGGLRFEDVSKDSGLAYPGWGVGVCTADYDGDGWQDLFVTTVGRSRLYRNRGNGTFEDVTAKSGIVAEGWSAGCAFGDYDGDQDLDLFVSRYVEIDLDNLPEFGKGKTCQFREVAVQCGPRGLPGTPDLLFRNEGDGTFTEVGKAAGVDDPDGYFGLGAAWFDFNEDGWLDLFVANDSNPNFFYVNQKDGTFQQSAFPLGVAVSEDGGEQGCMGVAVGDYRNEGRFSLYVTNFAEEYNNLYRNQGQYFTDVSFRSASAPTSLPFVGWGTAFFDYDHDGWLDLMAVNGHVYPQLASVNLGASATYRQRRLLYHNRGDGTFSEVGERFGPNFTEHRVSRGLALGDLDNDGRLDMVINELDGKAQVLRNVRPLEGRWLMVELEGKAPNTDAIGAVVKVQAGKLSQQRLLRSGASYLSQHDLRQHFGLGAAKRVDRIEVRWPDGSTTVRENVAVDQHLTIQQDQ